MQTFLFGLGLGLVLCFLICSIYIEAKGKKLKKLKEEINEEIQSTKDENKGLRQAAEESKDSEVGAKNKLETLEKEKRDLKLEKETAETSANSWKQKFESAEKRATDARKLTAERPSMTMLKRWVSNYTSSKQTAERIHNYLNVVAEEIKKVQQ